MTMNLTSTYAVSLGALIGLALLHQTSVAIGQQLRQVYARLVQKRLDHPLITTRPQGSTNISRLDSIFIISFIAANAVCLALRIQDKAQLVTRSSQLFSINAILLYLGGHTSLYADRIFQLRLEKYSLMHRWTGRICIAEATLHAVAAGTAHPGSLEGINISVGKQYPGRQVHSHSPW